MQNELMSTIENPNPEARAARSCFGDMIRLLITGAPCRADSSRLYVWIGVQFHLGYAGRKVGPKIEVYVPPSLKAGYH